MKTVIGVILAFALWAITIYLIATFFASCRVESVSLKGKRMIPLVICKDSTCSHTVQPVWDTVSIKTKPKK